MPKAKKKFKPVRMLFEIEGSLSSELIKSERKLKEEIKKMFDGLGEEDLDGQTYDDALESWEGRWDCGAFQIEEA